MPKRLFSIQLGVACSITNFLIMFVDYYIEGPSNILGVFCLCFGVMSIIGIRLLPDKEKTDAS